MNASTRRWIVFFNYQHLIRISRMGKSTNSFIECIHG